MGAWRSEGNVSCGLICRLVKYISPEPIRKLPLKKVECSKLRGFFSKVIFWLYFFKHGMFLFLIQVEIHLANKNQDFFLIEINTQNTQQEVRKDVKAAAAYRKLLLKPSG